MNEPNEIPSTSITPWPNKQEPVDGVIPTKHVDQDPHLFDNINDHTSVQMEG